MPAGGVVILRGFLQTEAAIDRITVVEYNIVNSGSPFLQWAKGLRLASGDWIWIAESDDFCDPNFLEVMINGCIKTQCQIGFCKSFPVNDQGQKLDRQYISVAPGKYNGVQFLMQYLLQYNVISNASSVLCSAALMKTILREDVNEFKLFGDWITWIRACMNSDIYCSSLTANFHRTHPDSVRATTKRHGMFGVELRKFRDLVKAIVRDHEDYAERRLLAEMNRCMYVHDLGMHGCELVRDKRYMSSIFYIALATIRGRLNLYYVRGAFYWLLKSKELREIDESLKIY